MRAIYLDKEFRCHVTDDGTGTPLETDSFDGKCDVFVEGHRYVPAGEIWVRSDGTVFKGNMIAPWQPDEELAAAQREYELALIADMRQALETLGVTVDA